MKTPICGILTVALWIINSVTSYNVHKDMTVDELRRTFHVDSHHLVPEYEVIQVHRIRKRYIEDAPHVKNSLKDDTTKPSKLDKKKEDRTLLHLSAFGKPLKLNLVRTEGLFKKGKLKLWSVHPNATAQHGLEYIELPETDEEIGEIYQDEANQAAILLRNDNDSVVVEGSIGPDLVIRPLPERLQDKAEISPGPLMDDEEFLDSEGELSAEVSIDTGLPIKRNSTKARSASHIVYKRKGNEDDSMSDYAFMEPDHLAKRYKRNTQSSSKRNRRKRDAPYTIYPEILVIVDYDGYRLHAGDNVQIKRYFVSFWNGVDLRYKLLKGPKVRISIAGIIISRGRDATPYLERNRVGRDAIDSAAALTDMGKYLFRERRLPVYDIAVAITKLDMCRRSYPSDSCNRGTAGFAYVGGACVVNKRLEKVNSVAIIEDTGGFSGIIVAAHEVGHLLGAVHDGSPPPSYLGGPGAEKCQWTDGYIMSDLRHTERGFRWSSCSVQSFHHFLNGDTATCLYNAPHEDESLPRVLPGKLLSLDAQCRRDRGTSACFKDDRVCAQLFCFDSSSGYCVAYRPAAEGSACGDGQYCLNGRCVAEHENIIPDYSQNAPSYVRRNNQGRPLFDDADDDDNQEDGRSYKTTKSYKNNYYTTKSPYYKSTRKENQFSATQKPSYTTRNYFTTTSRTTTTTRKYFTSTTTKPPYSKTIRSTSTKSAFKDFGQSKTSTPVPVPPGTISTKRPFSPFKFGIFEIKPTTKSPYDFADFGKPSSRYINNNNNNNDNVNNNYLKRSYDSASYYSASSNAGKVNIRSRYK